MPLKENKNMANLFTDTASDFAKKTDLAENKTRFCIDACELVTQKHDGKVCWWLQIHYDSEEEGVVMKTLTFDQSPKRNELFQRAIDTQDYPQHNCFLVKRDIKGGKTFYQLNQEREHRLCACSTPIPESAPDSNDDLAPF